MSNLNDNGIINLKKVATELNISELTVRRDFEKMESVGKLKRVQGGAILEEEPYGAELPMRKKLTLHMEAKTKVAKYAAGLVKDHDCVFIDGGTSTAQIIDFICNRRIKIVTYNELVVRKLVNPVAEIFVIGGKYIPQYNMYIGPAAQDLLKQFHFDIGIFGCAGVNLEENMAYTTETESLLMKRIALERSTKSMLLLDSSKLQKQSFLRFTDMANFNNVICEMQDSITETPSNFIMV